MAIEALSQAVEAKTVSADEFAECKAGVLIAVKDAKK